MPPQRRNILRRLATRLRERARQQVGRIRGTADALAPTRPRAPAPAPSPTPEKAAPTPPEGDPTLRPATPARTRRKSGGSPLPSSPPAPESKPKRKRKPKPAPEPEVGGDDEEEEGLDPRYQTDDALTSRLESLSEETALIVAQLVRRGRGQAARALLGIPDAPEPPPAPEPSDDLGSAPTPHPDAPGGPPPEPALKPPAQPAQPAAGAPPGAPPPTPPTPPDEPPPKPPAEPAPAPKRKADSPLLQGSYFHVPLGDPEDVWQILWNEWLRAGIGLPRGAAAPDERDASGRLRGPVLDRDQLPYLPTVQVHVPGRGGYLVVPSEDIVDYDRFSDFLEVWGIDGRVTLQIEGMSASDGSATTRNVWTPGGS